MGFATGSDRIVDAALWTGIGATAVAVLMLAAVLVMRVAFFARRRRKERFIAKWRPLLLRAIDGEAVAVPAIAAADRTTFLSLWIHYQSSVRGPPRQALNDVARASGMDAVARRWLKRRTLRLRLSAVCALGYLGERGALAQLQRLTEDANPALSLAAARALLQIDAPMTLPLLLPSFAQRQEWSLAAVASLLAEAGADTISAALAVYLDEAAAAGIPTAALSRLISLLKVAEVGCGRAAIRRILGETHNPELIAACLKACNDPRELELVRSYLSHPDWIVRTQAVRTLGHMGVPQDRAALLTCLNDTSWWVRYRAAEALASLPFVTREELTSLTHRTTDRYGADMLRQVLAEREGAL